MASTQPMKATQKTQNLKNIKNIELKKYKQHRIKKNTLTNTLNIHKESKTDRKCKN